VFDGLWRAGAIELELVPQATLAERIRAAGAGIGASSRQRSEPSSAGRRRVRRPRARARAALRADYADPGPARPLGQPRYRKAARNRADHGGGGACTIVQVRRSCGSSALDPEAVVTPGIYVARVRAAEAGSGRSRRVWPDAMKRYSRDEMAANVARDIAEART
jgi:3-oxoadipate CoA-transferase alpha subunit